MFASTAAAHCGQQQLRGPGAAHGHHHSLRGTLRLGAPALPRQDELLELQEREEAGAVEAAAARERADHQALMQQANLDGLEVPDGG